MKKRIKNFFEEFKKFITRGNVLDMSVGVIVGGAFTGIVNGLSNFILKPLINWLIAVLLGKDGLEGAITMLSPAYTDVVDANGAVVGQTLDLANSIYIDWGSFISAIINFLLIAIVLFSIVRMINRLNELRDKAEDEVADKRERLKAIRKLKKEKKVSFKEAEALYDQKQAFLATTKALTEEAAAAKAAEEAKLAEEKAAEEARLAEEKAMQNTKLLQEILDVLKTK